MGKGKKKDTGTQDTHCAGITAQDVGSKMADPGWGTGW